MGVTAQMRHLDPPDGSSRWRSVARAAAPGALLAKAMSQILLKS